MMTNHITAINIVWLVVGFSGQLVFTARFVLQWLHSERHRKSLIPIGFWYLSILGSLTLLIYAIHRHDPVFIVGQLFGILVYSRNLYFIYQERNKLKIGEQ